MKFKHYLSAAILLVAAASTTFAGETTPGGWGESVVWDNWTQGLQGHTAGLRLEGGSTGIIPSRDIILRGSASFAGNRAALIVVDGVPVAGGAFNYPDGSTLSDSAAPIDFGNALSDLNPDDIESITVLKGSAAAAIYGYRGGNGAILITTKNGSGAIGSRNKVASRDVRIGFSSAFTATVADLAGVKDLSALPDAADIYSAGTRFDNLLSIEAASGANRFRFSFKNTRNDWILPGTGYGKNSVSLSFNQKAGTRVELKGKVAFFTIDSDSAPASGLGSDTLPYSLITAAPGASLKAYKDEYYSGEYNASNYRNPDRLVGGERFTNPYRTLEEMKNSLDRDRAIASLGATVNILNGLSINALVGLDLNNEFRAYQRPKYSKGFADGWYREQTVFTNELSADVGLRYSSRVADERLGINACLGGAFSDRFYGYWTDTLEKISIEGTYNTTNYPREIMPKIDVWRARKRVGSAYGTLSLDWDKIWLLDLTLRDDYHSALARQYRNQIYASAGASARFEHFTFHLASGSAGKDIDPLLTSQVYEGYGNIYGTYHKSYSSSRIDLKPERVVTIESGIEGRFFDDKLSFDANIFQAEAKNQFCILPGDLLTGSASYLSNCGTLLTRGWEFSISATALKSENLRWDNYLNIAGSTTILSEMGAGWKEGEPHSMEIGGGLDGKLFILDYIGEKTGQIWTLDSSDKMSYRGSINPAIYGGFGSSLNWGSVKLEASFSFQAGAKAYSASYAMSHEIADSAEAIFPTDYLRLSSLTASYKIPTKVIKKLEEASLSIYATNLLTLSKFPVGNPDVAILRGENIVGGFEAGSFPHCRNIGVKLNFTF